MVLDVKAVRPTRRALNGRVWEVAHRRRLEALWGSILNAALTEGRFVNGSLWFVSSTSWLDIPVPLLLPWRYSLATLRSNEATKTTTTTEIADYLSGCTGRTRFNSVNTDLEWLHTKLVTNRWIDWVYLIVVSTGDGVWRLHELFVTCL